MRSREEWTRSAAMIGLLAGMLLLAASRGRIESARDEPDAHAPAADRADNGSASAADPTAGPGARAPEIRVDEHGRLVRNGVPFFPLLIYSSGTDRERLRELREAGFNLTHEYGIGYSEPPERCVGAFSARLQRCDEERMPLFYYELSNRSYGGRNYLLPEWLPAALRGVEQQVRAFKDHPGFAFWSLGEEFHSGGAAQQDGLRAVSALVRRLDPGRPIVVGDYSPADLARNLAHADIGILWSYPDFYRDGGHRVPLDQMAARFEELSRLLAERRKPVLGLVQLFNLGIAYPRGLAARRAPNHFEMRSMTYQAVIHGAAGIGYYHAYGHEAWPGSWLAVKRLGQELSTLSPVLLDVTAPACPVQPVRGQVDLMCKRHDGEWFVFAVSRSANPQVVEFASRGVKSLHVLGEMRVLPIPDPGGFRDAFRPYEARVYSTSAGFWPLPPLSRIESECEAAEAEFARREAPNLASFVNGSYFEADGDPYYLHAVNNGEVQIPLPFLKGVVSLHFAAAKRFTTIEVYGRPLERWNPPVLRAFSNGHWEPLRVVRSELDGTATPNRLVLQVEPVTAERVEFTFPGIYAHEIRVFDR